MKATNADTVKSQADRVGWYVGGSYIVDEIIGDEEARRVIDEWNEAHPDQQVEQDYPRESGKVFDAEKMALVEPDSDVRYSKAGPSFVTDKYFDRRIDRWDSLDGKYITVGTIRNDNPIHLVGAPSGKLYYDVSKLKKNMSEHGDHLNTGILKQVPRMLADPMTIVEFKPGEGTNTISVYGNLFIEDGTPVTVGIVVNKGRGGGVIDKIRTIHARGDFASQINDDSVLYLKNNKKEINSWYQALGINVPLGGTQLGVIRTVDFNDIVPQPASVVKPSGENSSEKSAPTVVLSDNGQVATVDDVAVASNMADLITEDPRPADYDDPERHSITTKDQWKKPDPTLKKMYVLIGAFEDGDEVVPVKMEVKEFIDKPNTLYVTVTMNGIKKTEVSTPGIYQNNGVAHDARSVLHSVPQLMRFVNPSDTDLTKYFPESMRTEEQNAALIKKTDNIGTFDRNNHDTRSSRSLSPDYASLDVEEINANEITSLNDITEKLRETAHLLKGVGRLDEAAASEARPGNDSLNRDYYITGG